MAKRQGTIKADSTELQGEGSYVVLRRLTWGQVKDNIKVTQGKDEKDVETVTLNVDMVLACVIDWNWVDDDGNPLPLPRNDPEVAEMLLLEEITFLSNTLIGDFRANQAAAGGVAVGKQG